MEDEEGRLVSPLVGSLEKDRGVLVEDPRWQGKEKCMLQLSLYCNGPVLFREVSKCFRGETLGDIWIVYSGHPLDQTNWLVIQIVLCTV